MYLNVLCYIPFKFSSILKCSISFEYLILTNLIHEIVINTRYTAGHTHLPVVRGVFSTVEAQRSRLILTLPFPLTTTWAVTQQLMMPLVD